MEQDIAVVPMEVPGELFHWDGEGLRERRVYVRGRCVLSQSVSDGVGSHR